MNKTYLNYLFKENKKTLFVIIFFSLIIGPVLSMFMELSFKEGIKHVYGLNINIYFFLVLVLFYIIPFISFKYINNKKSVDTYFSLPISRKEMFFTKFIFVLIETLGLFIINNILIILVFLIRGAYIDLDGYLKILGNSLIMGLLIVSVNTYIISKCNSDIDSLICMGIYTLLPFTFVLAINSFIVNVAYGITSGPIDYLAFSPTLEFINLLISQIHLYINKLEDYYSYGNYQLSNYALVIYLILGIGFTYLSYRSFKNRQGEDAEQITDNVFMYKTILPVGLLSLLFTIDYKRSSVSTILVTLIMIYLIYVVGVFISSRKLRISKNNVIVMAASLLFTFSIYFLFNNNRAFGLSKIYPDKFKQLSISIHNAKADYEYLSIELSDSKDIVAMQRFQSALVDYHYEINSEDQDNAIQISYYYDNKENYYYHVFNSHDLKKIMDKSFDNNQLFDVEFHKYNDYSYKNITMDELLALINTR